MSLVYTVFLLIFVIVLTIRLLLYYASKEVPLHVRINVFLGWVVALTIVAILPLDVRTTLNEDKSVHGPLGTLWTILYTYTIMVQIAIVPVHQEYILSGEFTKGKKLKAGVRTNLLTWAVLTGLTVLGILFLFAVGKEVNVGNLINIGIAISNTVTLVCVIFLLGFGLVDIPRQLWRRSNISGRQRYIRHRIGNQAKKLKKAHLEFSTSVILANHCSGLIRDRNPLRPFADRTLESAKVSIAFQPSQEAKKQVASKQYYEEEGYSDDVPELARLRRRIKSSRNGFLRMYGELQVWILKSFHLRELVYNLEESQGRVYHTLIPGTENVSGSEPMRGAFSSYMIRNFPGFWWFWKCTFEPVVVRLLAIFAAILSVMVIEAEASSVTEGDPDLSVFSLLIHGSDCRSTRSGIITNILVTIPLLYICYATGHSVFKLGTFSFYSLVPKHSDSFSLLLNTMLMSRFAPALAYNFLRIISVDSDHCIAELEKSTAFYDIIGMRMDGLPIVGDRFNLYFPIIVVLFCLMVATNVMDTVCGYFVKSSSYYFVADEDEDDDEEGKLGDEISKAAWSNIQNGYELLSGLERFYSDADDIQLIESNGKPPTQQDGKPGNEGASRWTRFFKRNTENDGYQRVANSGDAGTSTNQAARDSDKTLLRSLDSSARTPSDGGSSSGPPPRRSFEDMKARLKAAATTKGSRGKSGTYQQLRDNI